MGGGGGGEVWVKCVRQGLISSSFGRALSGRRRSPRLEFTQGLISPDQCVELVAKASKQLDCCFLRLLLRKPVKKTRLLTQLFTDFTQGGLVIVPQSLLHP